MVANFCNVGAQISSWSSLIPYMKQYTPVSERTAAFYLTGYSDRAGGGAIRVYAADAVLLRQPHAGLLRCGECAA